MTKPAYAYSEPPPPHLPRRVGRRSASGTLARIGGVSACALAHRTILVADESADARDELLGAISRHGGDAIGVGSLADALRVVRAVECDALVIDAALALCTIDVGGEDGEVISRWTSLPRVVMTDRSADEDEADGELRDDGPALTILRRPVDPAIVVGVLAAMCDDG